MRGDAAALLIVLGILVVLVGVAPRAFHVAQRQSSGQTQRGTVVRVVEERDMASDRGTLHLRTLEVAVIPFDADHAAAAIRAWERFGRWRHPAALNLGDCITYAAARVAGLPIVATGEDFARTDATLA